jgi:hypothetical protein
MTAGVGTVMDGVLAGVLEFPAFVFLIVGMLHPATITQPTIKKRASSMRIFSGICDLFPGVCTIPAPIYYQAIGNLILFFCTLMHRVR